LSDVYPISLAIMHGEEIAYSGHAG